MVLLLCIGDLHIPHRAIDLPARFKQLLQPGKIHHILSPGNLCCRDAYEYLKTVCSNIHLTKGDFDVINAPEDKILKVENFTIGICHGHQIVPAGDKEALGILQRRMNVDILITGHTHKYQVIQYEQRLLMNPGSATGAHSIFEKDVIPSFILMDINESKVDVYVYQLIDGESKVKKLEFVKPKKTAPEIPIKQNSEIKSKILDESEKKKEGNKEEGIDSELEGPNPMNMSPMVADKHEEHENIDEANLNIESNTNGNDPPAVHD